jgi:site-specific DNA-methyltransferase (cytosine-N4-specific)
MGRQLDLWTNSEPVQERSASGFAGADRLHITTALGPSRRILEQKYASLLRERLELAEKVSYVGNKQMPLLRLYRYKEAFAYAFVQQMIQELAITPQDCILDPFCGMGTTNFVAGLHGVRSFGIDQLPVAVFAARTLPLFLQIEPGWLRNTFDYLRTIVAQQPPAPIAEDVAIMRVAFDAEALLLLRQWKSAIENLPSPSREIMLLLLLAVLETCSYTSKDGQFLRLRRDKTPAHPTEALCQKVQQAEQDILLARQLGWHRVWHDPVILQGDARQLLPSSLNPPPTTIITSPPYANRYDYTRSYSLELCFAFVRNFEELKSLRFSILRSHIEAKVEADELPSHPAVLEVLQVLHKRRDQLNNPRIPAMIAGYFIDMEKVIQRWAQILVPGGRVVMVVDNVRFDGEVLPVDLILSDMAERCGFLTEALWIARYKGNSSQQMGRYGRLPVRETVLVWRKP